MCKKTLELLNKSLEIYKEMKTKENEMKLLKEKLDLYGVKIQKELEEKGETELRDEAGSVVLVVQDRQGSFDEDKLKSFLGTEDLKPFRKNGKIIKYLQYNLVK